MNLIRPFVGGLALATILTIVSCGTTPSKTTTTNLPRYQTHQDYYKAGQASFDKWGEEFSYTELKTSFNYFRKAIKQQPDNIQYQKSYYLVLFARSILESHISEDALIEMFDLIHPAVQASIAAPAKSTYIREKSQKESAAILTEHLTRAIRQQPYDPYPWFELSDLFEKQNNFWLAAATAKQAAMLGEESAKAKFKVGTQLNNLAEQKKCNDDWKPYKHQAIKHIAAASAMEPGNANYLYSQAYLYQTLGLMPLSLMQVKKSLDIKETYWPTRLYAQVALALKKYELAENLSNKIIETYGREDGYLFKSMSFAGRNRWAEAQEEFEHYIKKGQPKVNSYVILSWISNLASDEKKHPEFNQHWANTSWEKLIKDFFNNETLEDENNLNHYASNLCEQSLGHFYNAYKFWLDGNIPATERQLIDTVSHRSLQFAEVYWAEIILAHLQQ